MIASVGRMMRKGGGGLSWPAGMKEHIKAWYDPKKQGMTNFDVIEAYIEDFTKWAYRNSRGTAKITNNTIVITSVVEINNIVEDDNEPYSDLTIRVTGVTENRYLIVRQGRGKPETHIKKDGVYTFKDNNLYFGFGVSVIGECNITITQLPTSILKDFSGNRHDAYLYGFKGRLNSGVGIYKIDFSKTLNLSAFDNFERLNNKVIAKGNYSGNWNVFGEYDINGIVKNKVTIKITGLNNIKEKLFLEYGYYTTDSKYIKNIILIDKDGIYTYDLNDIIIPDESNIAHTIYNRMYFGEQIINDINLIVEEIPDYSNQLCYDGKSYAVAYDMPILTDYTVMAERTWFEKEEYSAFISNSLGGMEDPSNGAFSVELKSLNSFTTISFGSITSIGIPEKGITYQTKQSYNGNSINVGTKESNDILILGGRYFYKNDNVAGNTWTGCHGAIIVADRSFTEEEINWLKDNLFRK